MSGFLYFIIAMLFTSPQLWAHGEDKPGPHGGHIRMPSNFHIEIVAETDAQFKVYLLDMQFKNPTIENSALAVQIKTGSKKRNALCDLVASAQHYTCRLPEKYKKGQLLVRAKRLGIEGIEMKYEWPLSAFKTNPPVDHSGHH